MDLLNHAIFKNVIILFLIFCYQPLMASEAAEVKAEKNNTYLQVARTQLDIANDDYTKGNIDSAKRHLQHANDWLDRAVEHSQSEVVKTAVTKLATEIKNFRSTLNKSSEKHQLARFWHQTTSLIQRESEHLIHSYTETSRRNQSLKHLLDAKMHFYTAEYDLFFSHNSDDAGNELRQSVEYLNQAESLAESESKQIVNNLIQSINEIISLSESSKITRKQDVLIQTLDNVVDNLKEAEAVAPAPVRSRLESIRKKVIKIEKETFSTNLKFKYDAIMKMFNRAIKNT